MSILLTSAICSLQEMKRMEKKTIELYRKKFDDIRHESDGIEYWYARELMKLLDYVQWRNFDNAVNKAMFSCENNGNLESILKFV